MKIWRRWKRILVARRFERELQEEVRFHREMAGGPAFGSVALAMEDSRAVWRFAWVDSLAQDVRYALRGFRKAPGFALTVVLTLSLGLGTLATSFSVFNALVLRPFAVKDPYSLYTFLGWGPTKGSYQSRAFTWRTFTDFRQRNGAFSDVLGYRDLSANVDKNPIAAQAVTGNYFTMLGARICLGRPILESDDVPGNEVAVASYAAWKSRLGADPAAVGKRIRLRGLDDRQVELVGVACPEFNGLADSRIDFWLSLPLAIPLGGGQIGADVFGPKEPEAIYGIVGRLKPGMTPEGAEAALVTYGQQIYTTWRYKADRPRGARLRQAATVYPLNADSIRVFLPVFAAFGLILLIACANVSNMMLARGLARQREIGIRISLGAGRARVVRQLLTEGFLLAVPAAVAAFGVAHGSIRAALWLQTNVLHGNRMWTRLLWNDAPDWRVLLFLLATACIATVVFGLIPALQTVRSRLVEANRGEFAADRRPARLRSALVVAQVTVCALLLIATGVALRGERRILARDLGLDVSSVFVIQPAALPERVSGKNTRDLEALRRSAAERLAALPETESVGVCGMPPNTRAFWRPLEIETPGGIVPAPFNLVSPEYFRIFGVAIRGRNFSAEEAASEAQVAIVTEAAARRIAPHGDILGRVIRGTLTVGPRLTYVKVGRVVGVVPDSRFLLDTEGPDGQKRGTVYFPTAVAARGANYYTPLLVRMRSAPAAARRTLEKTIRELAPNARPEALIPVTGLLDNYLYPYRALGAIAGFLGGLALLLTASGVFGVSSYAVAQRKKEFGIRIALGAGEARVTGMVLRDSLRLAAAGAIAGAVAALALARTVAHSLREIDVFDFSGYAAGALVVLTAAVVATWLPARRAVRVDPAKTLRCD